MLHSIVNVQFYFAFDAFVLKMLKHVVFRLRVAVTHMPSLFLMLYQYSKPIDTSEKYVGKVLFTC